MQIKQTRDLTSPYYQDGLAIRQAVFVAEQKVPAEMEIDEFILTPCPDSRREESQRPDGFSGLLRDTTGTDTGQY